jgi:hypothetical protein
MDSRNAQRSAAKCTFKPKTQQCNSPAAKFLRPAISARPTAAREELVKFSHDSLFMPFSDSTDQSEIDYSLPELIIFTHNVPFLVFMNAIFTRHKIFLIKLFLALLADGGLDQNS